MEVEEERDRTTPSLCHSVSFCVYSRSADGKGLPTPSRRSEKKRKDVSRMRITEGHALAWQAQQALGCGAKHTKEAWHLRPVGRRSHADSIKTHSVFRAKPVWNRVGSALSATPAPQEQHLPRSAAGRVKGHPQPSRTDRRLQPNSAAVSAARLGNKRTAFTVRCPSPAGELDGETQFRYAAYVLTFLKFK